VPLTHRGVFAAEENFTVCPRADELEHLEVFDTRLAVVAVRVVGVVRVMM
jgi:hypothetical protein